MGSNESNWFEMRWEVFEKLLRYCLQTNSELFTLIIRNIQQENSITRDFQKNLKSKAHQSKT